MKHILLILLLVIFLLTAGCGDKSKDTAVTPQATTKAPEKTPTKTPQTTKTVITTTLVTVATPAPVVEPNITEGFWCRETTINIDKASTEITECYQFFDDGTYLWGYSPGHPMGKSASCSGSPAEKCRYKLNARGQYEVEGGYMYTKSGYNLIDPHDPPYFVWKKTGFS